MLPFVKIRFNSGKSQSNKLFRLWRKSYFLQYILLVGSPHDLLQQRRKRLYSRE
jgi:hypothetical protein